LFSDVEKLLTFNLLKSKLRSCNPFRNANVPNEGGVSQFRKFGQEIGCHALNDRKMNERLMKISHKTTNPEDLVKIDPRLRGEKLDH